MLVKYGDQASAAKPKAGEPPAGGADAPQFSTQCEALLVKAPEAARLLAISQRKLWELTNCGEVPCVRIGAAVRYSPADLAAWIESKKSA